MREKKVTFRDVRLANRGRGRNVSAAPYTFFDRVLTLIENHQKPSDDDVREISEFHAAYIQTLIYHMAGAAGVEIIAKAKTREELLAALFELLDKNAG